MRVINSTLRSNRLDPELPTGATTTGGVVRFAGAESTTGRGVVAWKPAFFFTAGLVWRAFFAAALAFVRWTSCAGSEVACVGAGARDVAGAAVTTGGGAEGGAGAGSRLEVVGVLPLDVPFEVVGSCWTAAGGGSGLGLCASPDPALPTSRQSTASGKRWILR
jgi:hypothetical protein